MFNLAKTYSSSRRIEDGVATSVENVVKVGFAFETTEEAEAFAGIFPKYCKARMGRLHADDKAYYSVSFDISVNIDERTGGANETAQKRRDKVLAVLAENSIDYLG
jgi:hypothetical protein